MALASTYRDIIQGCLVKGEDEQDNLFVLDVFPHSRVRVHLPSACIRWLLDLNPGGH
jgi:hypothetical protein